jgi:L-Ala-D/L-Glu epimerase
MKRSVRVARHTWPLKEPFVISRGVQTLAPVILVQIHDHGVVGRGEAAGVSYHGETQETMIQQVECVRADIAAGAGRRDLLDLLPPGGARNALDAAMWDLDAKLHGVPVWKLAGIEPHEPVSAVTIGIRSLEAYEARALSLSDHPWIKIKVDGEAPLDAVAAVRRGAPKARLIVDANQAWSIAQLRALVPGLLELNVDLLEQPVPADTDAELAEFPHSIPICADEPLNTVADLPRVKGRYEFVNVKLDKCGGLTAALDLVKAARELGLRQMVGCMTASSLAMAPAMVVAQFCEVIDLDGPLLLSEDWPDCIAYRAGAMSLSTRTLWG